MAWAVLFDGKMWYTYVQHRIYAAAENKRGFMNKEKHIIIAGGGAAGMIAAVAAAREGCKVSLYEKNEKLGKKLFITGKGRCNVTNACDMEELFGAVVTNRKFLFSSFYGFTNEDVMELFEEAGLPLKIERGNRVFPCSDHSSDVIAALERMMRQAGVKVYLRQEIKGLAVRSEEDTDTGAVRQVCCGICLEGLDGKEKEVPADRVILATGGVSYPSTGSTGDGHAWAKMLGHKVTDLLPALVPFEAAEKEEVKALQGLSLKNIEIAVYNGKKELYREFGEMLFTHFGISGPLVLSASAYTGKAKGEPIWVEIDLKPALTIEQLDARILRDFDAAKNKQVRNALDELLPKKLIPVMIELAEIDPFKQVNAVTKEERERLIACMKKLTLHVVGTRGYEEAIITRGGVSVKEINPKTMEAKQIPGLYFIGEVLDVDALTGGFNLQIAWATAATVLLSE